ncbi:MAG TPA: ribosome maturation factor RimM [Candidatus Kapabacteria bacterium]|jgi:16S rRNA processing protein RimM|nr:ribosome maturation factor RimM [Candidatus Kapabacteria bacterium]
MEDLVLIAKILKPHGITGEVAVESFTHDDQRFEKLDRIFLRDKKGSILEKAVESFRLTAKGVLLKLAGVDDRDAAEALRNMEVLIPENERPKLPEGQAYYDEIAGMTVIDDESGEELGKVVNVIEAPAGEVFVLDLKGKEHLVTNAGEEVRRVDTKKKELRVKLLPEY